MFPHRFLISRIFPFKQYLASSFLYTKSFIFSPSHIPLGPIVKIVKKLNKQQPNINYYRYIMGSSYVHPDYTTSHEDISLKIYKSPKTSTSENNYTQNCKEEHQDIQPIIIPCFITRESPFKIYTERETEERWRIEAQNHEQAEEREGKEVQSIEQKVVTNSTIWTYVFYNTKTLFAILDFLPCQDSINLSYVNHRLYSQFYFYRLFHRQHNWHFAMYIIEGKRNKQGKSIYQKLLNQSVYQESEHSLDLDRLDSFFLYDEDVNDQLARVDKILRTINATGITYFQGLNSMIVVLTSLFDDQTAYWIALLLIKRTQNIQINSQIYRQVMDKIDKQVKLKCEKCYNKLQKLDLGVEYFAMKWVMGLFSYDLSRHILIYFWDLVISFGLSALKWFTVSIFKCLEVEIQEKECDQLNTMLKSQLKSQIKDQTSLKILQMTRIYISNQLYGQGSSQIFKPWAISLTQSSFFPPFLKYPSIKQKFDGIKIDPIDEQQLQHAQEIEESQCLIKNQFIEKQEQKQPEQQNPFQTLRTQKEIELSQQYETKPIINMENSQNQLQQNQ